MILLDTSGLLAAYDRDDRFHRDVVRVLQDDQRRILSPFVLAELDYLLATRAGQDVERQALRDVANGAYELVDITRIDMAHCIELMEQYPTMKLGVADTSIMVIAARFECFDVLTLDQRHFRAVLHPGGKPFRLLPHDA